MPNCKAIVSESHESIGNIKHIRIITDKDILSGEELTLNYIINKLDNPLWEFEYEVSQ
jgi:SET domain-containing protein